MLFGFGLAILGFFAAGAGHGTYVLLGASSAPAGALGVWAAMAGAPVFWASVGAVFDWMRESWRNRIIPPILLLHYCSVGLLLIDDTYGDWMQLRRLFGTLWPMLAAWVALYAFGQVVLWRTLFGGPADVPPQPTSAAGSTS